MQQPARSLKRQSIAAHASKRRDILLEFGDPVVDRDVALGQPVLKFLLTGVRKTAGLRQSEALLLKQGDGQLSLGLPLGKPGGIHFGVGYDQRHGALLCQVSGLILPRDGGRRDKRLVMSFKLMVRKGGVEPPRSFGAVDFESSWKKGGASGKLVQSKA